MVKVKGVVKGNEGLPSGGAERGNKTLQPSYTGVGYKKGVDGAREMKKSRSY